MSPGSYDGYSSEAFSYPATTAYSDSLDNSAVVDNTANSPRVLLMGTRRSGKSSIQKVVFYKMSPHETLFLESTNEVRNRDVNTSALVQFQLVDFPGNYDFFDKRSKITPESVFGGNAAHALVFVMDAQDEDTYTEAIEYFGHIMRTAHKVNPNIFVHILIHKVDGDAYMSDDLRATCHHEIKRAVMDELAEANIPIRPVFYMTSIYDHSVFEAFSKIVQKLISQLALLERLLDGLIASCRMEKAFLFDVASKIYVATDSNPVDMQTYELCSDMIDVVIDVSCIYGVKGKQDALAYDNNSASVIKLSNNYMLCLREVNRYLALVCLMRCDSISTQGLVEYNFACFKRAIADLLEARIQAKPVDT